MTKHKFFQFQSCIETLDIHGSMGQVENHQHLGNISCSNEGYGDLGKNL